MESGPWPFIKIFRENCPTNIEFVSPLRRLRKLYLRNCPNISDLSPLTNLRVLRQVELDKDTNITDVTPLATLVELRRVGLNGCTGVKDVSCLKALPNLNEFDVDDSGVNYDALPAEMQQKGETFTRSWMGFLGSEEGKAMKAQLDAIRGIAPRENFFQRLLRKLRGG